VKLRLALPVVRVHRSRSLWVVLGYIIADSFAVSSSVELDHTILSYELGLSAN
jgi:hypothetical protein